MNGSLGRRRRLRPRMFASDESGVWSRHSDDHCCADVGGVARLDHCCAVP